MEGTLAPAPIADRYHLQRELGRGTTGRVYLAVDLHLDRQVAVKVLEPRMASDQEVLSRFDEEIRLTARLQHPGIVNVFEAARTGNGLPCYVMTLARGKTMDELLDRLRASPDPWREMPLIERLTLYLKILEVMGYAHAQGVVHRDLKPANIIIGQYGEMWILDWGLARAVRDDPVTFVDDDLVADDVIPGPSTDPSALEPAAEPDTSRSASQKSVNLDAATVIMPDGEGDASALPLIANTSAASAATATNRPGTAAALSHSGAVERRDRQSPSEGGGRRLSDPQLSDRATVISRSQEAEPVTAPVRAGAAGLTAHHPVSPTSPTPPAGEPQIETDQITVKVGSDRIIADDQQAPTRRTTGQRPVSDRSERPGSDRTERDDSGRSPSTRHTQRIGTSSIRAANAGTQTSARRRSVSARFAAIGTSDSQRLARSTHQGQVLGSPAYMSPEQARGRSNEADQRTDIYSLGSILMELLCLHTPVEARSDDTLVSLLQRVREGQRTHLAEHWTDAPPALQQLCEGALAFDVQHRYPNCEVFAKELRQLLSQLSASYAELERQRLERERQEAWLPGGMWDFGANRNLGPFETASVAVGAEQVGQVHHPELGGVLLGGYGLQSYPLALRPGEDVRLTVETTTLRGGEFWICVRGAPPNASYQFRIGAFGGRWLAIARADGPSDVLIPTILSLKPMRERTSTIIGRNNEATHKVVVESAGSRLRLLVEGQDPLEVHDVQPLAVGEGHHLAIATNSSQIVVHQLMLERRRSPLLVPMHLIGHELLRQGLAEQAIAFYRGFLVSHGETSESAPARYMLAMALSGIHALDQAEAELRGFLEDHFDHALAQDAIFQLACLRLTSGGGIRRAVQEILSYQEAGDVVRTRFCLWMIPLLQHNLLDHGITDDQEFDLRLISSMLRGSPDESPVKQTLAQVMGTALRQYLNKAVDGDEQAILADHRERIRRITQLGYRLSIRDQRLLADYEDLSGHLRAVDDPAETTLCLGRADDNAVVLGDWVRDVLALEHLGCRLQLLNALQNGDELLPMERLLRAALRLREGDSEGGNDDLTWCFRLTDVLETERTSLVILNCARLGCFGLGYLPWDLVEEGLRTIQGSLIAPPLTAGAAFLAESMGEHEIAARMYQILLDPGSGFRLIGEQGLTRLASVA